MFKPDHKLIYSPIHCIAYYNVFVFVIVIVFVILSKAPAMIM